MAVFNSYCAAVPIAGEAVARNTAGRQRFQIPTANWARGGRNGNNGGGGVDSGRHECCKKDTVLKYIHLCQLILDCFFLSDCAADSLNCNIIY